MSEAESGKLHTLTEVSKRTNISMPTLQRYKKLYQDRIPSQGKGRSQRYPEEAMDVFLQLKQENIGKRGRPRKSSKPAAKRPAKAAKAPAKRGRRKKVARKAAAATGEKLLTLTEISKKTGISYPTLLRYVKTHLKDIPHEGKGRARRYKPEAVDVFKRLRGESSRGRRRGAAAAKKPAKRRGRPPKKATAAATKKRRGRPPASAAEAALKSRVGDLEKSHKQLERKLKKLEKGLQKPFKVTLQRR